VTLWHLVSSPNILRDHSAGLPDSKDEGTVTPQTLEHYSSSVTALHPRELETSPAALQEPFNSHPKTAIHLFTPELIILKEYV